ncbi:class I SAM-dependent methyltransferase [Egibacter rhizosphaerae]|uniref:class I SAM-dependent methyltransferase n=1 Tax=Egibacter rhizosphaerae TaxID=1670831 RepID=UPI0013F16016|nr:class I SAM-dependent methyltransferase [Egibacter rhizosphaerae]
MLGHATRTVTTVLELGSGGGNNANHLKAHFDLVLVDASEAMLETSRRINPECTHLAGDMRTVRLGRRFDAVFVHDAASYLTTLDDLHAARTAYDHVLPGGLALFAPDFVRETFTTGTHHGGRDRGERDLRYLEWTWEADPDDPTYIVDFAYLLREGATVRAVHDRHVCAAFPRDDWFAALRRAGFDEAFTLSGPDANDVLLARC